MNNFTIEKKTDPKEILKYLQMGISLPIKKEFQKYILSDLNYFQTVSLVLEINGKPEGHVLTFHDNTEILYFGFFGVLNHKEIYIEYLIKKLIDYARIHSFEKIQGPIYIPTVIFGWGLMEEESIQTPFRGKPVNPPIYNHIFLNNKFSIKHKIYTFESPLPLNNEILWDTYDYNNYELIHLKEWNDFFKYAKDFNRLNQTDMPTESTLTPSINNLSNNYTRFVMKYGAPFMLTFIKCIKTDEIVGYYLCLPNPFRQDENQHYDSLSLFSSVIDNNHQGKGIGLLLFKNICEKAWENKIKYVVGPVESNNLKMQNLAKKMGLLHLRTHLILERELLNL